MSPTARQPGKGSAPPPCPRPRPSVLRPVMMGSVGLTPPGPRLRQSKPGTARRAADAGEGCRLLPRPAAVLHMGHTAERVGGGDQPWQQPPSAAPVPHPPPPPTPPLRWLQPGAPPSQRYVCSCLGAGLKGEGASCFSPGARAFPETVTWLRRERGLGSRTPRRSAGRY